MNRFTFAVKIENDLVDLRKRIQELDSVFAATGTASDSRILFEPENVKV